MRFCAVTLGCKANQYDTGIIADIMFSRGHKQAKAGEGCDACIINTCAVTAESVRKSRQAVRRMKRLEPAAIIAACGCFSQLEHQAAAALGADIISGTGDKGCFVDRIETYYYEHKKEAENRQQLFKPQTPGSSLLATDTQSRRTRALLKIQDGCDNRCAYCVIPLARGSSRSMPLKELAEKARILNEQGHKEIVITGIEISSYSPGLPDALNIISAAAPDARLRLGSLNPDILTGSFIRKLSEIRMLCGHFHISLQSGCGNTLKAMGRRYTTNGVLDSVSALRETFDNCGITADLIAGFPGETDGDFEETLSFIETAAFSAMHIFPYSRRPGTKAAEMPQQVAGNIKQERVRAASAIAAKMSAEFKHAQIGKTLEVLFETRKGAYSTGHSGNYLSVAVPRTNARHGKIDKNTLANVRISGIKDGILYGEIV